VTSRPRTLLLTFAVPPHRFIGLAFGVAFLNLITFGLYKPYGITRVRQALYPNILIGRDALAYEGTAKALGHVTFYPQLAFLFLLLGPGILQFYVSFFWAGVIGVIQLFLLAFYYHFIHFRQRQYELSCLSWRGHSFGLEGTALNWMKTASVSQILVMLSLGLLAPWRRALLTRLEYDNLWLGRQRITCNLLARPLVPLYLVGWLLSWAGFAYAIWYGWTFGWLPVANVLNGGAADPAIAASVDASALSASSGMSGTISTETPAQIGTFMHALVLGFTLWPAWVVWRKLCLCLYEVEWQRAFCASLSCAGAGLRFDGQAPGLFLNDSAAFLANFMTANLTRPFATYIRLRLMCRNLVVTGTDSLESALAPQQRLQS
jgi:uncharacterized membrane protein YjgN (DUF898 family)